MTCVMTCMIFAAVSGSSVATTFAIGAVLIPALIQHGYPRPWATALQATSAELGVIIPPSIPMILFGVAAEVSIGELFIAGVGPGILIGVALMFFVWAYSKYMGWGKNDGEGRLSFGKATYQAGWALLMPFIVLGGIYGGIFTPTEAAAVAVLYSFIVGTLIYREIGFKDIYIILRKSVISSAVIAQYLTKVKLFWKIVLSYFLTDQAFIVSQKYFKQQPKNKDRHYHLLGSGFTLWFVWQLSTIAGIVLGEVIPKQLNLAFAVPLTFISLIIVDIKKIDHLIVAMTSGVFAIIFFNFNSSLS